MPKTSRACALLVWFSACSGGTADANAANFARIAALESKVQALETLLGGSASPAVWGFDISCPAPWQRLGPVGDAVWTCRKQQALPNGFWPNCNVTEAAIETQAPLSAKESFDASLAVPPMHSVRRISERPSALDTVPAHEAIYEHELLSKPLRVLATLAVRANHAYAVSCAAPPEAFATNEPSFRQITRSFKFTP